MKPYLIFLIIISAFLLFFHLGTRPLLSSGEARASEISLEMLQKGNLLVPYLNEEIILTKPVLFHWLIIVSYKIFGVSEFSSRVPSALAGVLVIILVYLFGKQCWDEKTGFIAGLILVTSPLFFWSSRCARIDSLLLLLITMSLYCFWRGWSLGWFLFMGLGVLAKGPIGVIVPLGIVVLFLFFIGRAQLLRRLNWFWGLILFFLVVSPWFIAIYFLVPHHKSEMFFVQQIYAWLGGGGEWYKGYVYIPHLILGFFPWSLALPGVFLFTWKKRDEKTVFLWTWAFVVFFIFALTGEKVSRYILPLYPAISLLVASMVNTKKGINNIFSSALVCVWFFIILACNLYTGFIEPELAAIAGQYLNRLLISAVGILIIIVGIYGIRKSSFTIPVAISFVSLLLFILCVIPIERDYYSPKPFCEMLKKEIPPDARIGAYKSWDNTIRYYFGRHVSVMHTVKGLLRFLNSQEKVYCFMWDSVYEGLPKEVKENVSVIKSGYRVLEHKVVLVSNKL